jgi:diaminohydroxyphosphoribosylaminopyrimidine deaminase/5-amino-6-(5-phosphoribosylamino)uracil reductase
MKRAIEEGEKGFGFVTPNPRVGCVVLNQKHELISVGYHQKFGGPHAEVEALKYIPEQDLEGAHVIVTLEPCAHQGKTPPCAQMLARLPIASVTYGLKDPFPAVSGKGIQILKDAGKEVIHLENYQEACEELAEIFLWNTTRKRAFVALKIASSLDGQIALQSGESQWITGEESRLHSHYLRGGYDAILVGRNTISIDDPKLNIRHPHFEGKQNKIVVLDPEGRLLKNISQYKISEVHKSEDILFVVREDIKVESKDHKIIPVPALPSGSLNLDDLTRKLYEEKIYSLFVEGGAQTYSEFVSQKAFQRLYLFQAPVIIGSKNGRSWSEGFSVLKLKEKLHLKNLKSHRVGEDLFLTGRL